MDNSARKKILVVDDSELNRAILCDMLKIEFDILEATNGTECLELLDKYSAQLDLVLLDLIMPGMSGFDVLEQMQLTNLIGEVPVIVISAENDNTYIEKAYDLGASDFIHRPFAPKIVRKRINNTIALYAKQKRLADMVMDLMYEKEKNSNTMVLILSHIVEFRNGESGLHVLHVNVLTELLLRRLLEKTDKYDFSEDDIAVIRMASSLHDIGKITIPEEVLNKPGRFTDEEFAVMQGHTRAGYDIIKTIPFRNSGKLIKYAAEICRWHHERYDGRGYPDGLVGDEIPISAQAVAIADVYDALTSKRCYKDEYSHEKAIEMIMNGECGAFNPLMLECLQDIEEKIRLELEDASLEDEDMRVAKKVADRISATTELSARNVTAESLLKTSEEKKPQLSLKEFYARVNGNYEVAISRFRSEATMMKMAGLFKKDNSMALLTDSIITENWEEAFRAVHTLKGIALNMEFTAFAKACADMTEALRGGGTDPDPAYYEAVLREYTIVVDALAELGI